MLGAYQAWLECGYLTCRMSGDSGWPCTAYCPARMIGCGGNTDWGWYYGMRIATYIFT